MGDTKHHLDINKLSFAGLLVTLGIVFGDIGTSPLYTIKAIVNNAGSFSKLLVYGALSCVFWTLTLHGLSRLFCISDIKALQLDSTNTVEEQVPITIDQPIGTRIKRLQ